MKNTPQEQHDKLREILRSYGNEEFGDCIVDEISFLYGQPTTIDVQLEGKILIEEVPTNYDHINNLNLRSMFEDEENEPIINTRLMACGYVGNRPIDFKGVFHEDDTWAIDQYDEDGEQSYVSFLYVSESEYEEDLKILGIL